MVVLLIIFVELLTSLLRDILLRIIFNFDTFLVLWFILRITQTFSIFSLFTIWCIKLKHLHQLSCMNHTWPHHYLAHYFTISISWFISVLINILIKNRFLWKLIFLNWQQIILVYLIEILNLITAIFWNGIKGLITEIIKYKIWSWIIDIDNIIIFIFS